MLLGILVSPCYSLDPDKPNVIVIFTDDHGYADLSSQGVLGDVRTPHVDALAAGGVRMTNGYVTAPQCVPSRAGLLTGKYQNRFGVESNGHSLDGFNAEATIAERLKQAGYATGMSGKWHLGSASEIVRHGFDDVFYKNSNRPGWANFDLEGNDVEPGAEQSGLYHLDANSAAARAFIDRHHDRPFFFYLAYRAPHVPLDAPEKYLSRFPGEMPERRRQALAMLSAVDDGVGGIIDTLRRHGIEERTLIFFIGDNGAPLKIHKHDAPGGGPGWDGSLNDPMNGEKGMLAEGGIRVPFVVHWKGRIPPGQVCDHPVISLDVAATAVALAGLPRDPALDGVNLIPHLSNGEAGSSAERAEGLSERTLYWRWIAQAAVREGSWKYLRGGARQYLFDLEADKEEKQNLIEEHPEIARRLQDKLDRWAGELNPPGLETKQMSETWEQYFDYYLDGKPAPPLRARAATDLTMTRGWIVRNGTIERKDGTLQVRPNEKGSNARGPFIVTAGLKLPPSATAFVRLRIKEAGTLGFAWREQGQKDFTPEQVVSFQGSPSADWQEHEVRLPGREEIIHVRLLLPAGGADVEQIEFRDATGKPLRMWQFREEA